MKCTFTGVTLHNFKGALQTFEDCIFSNCTFIGLSAANIRFRRCRFIGGSATGGWWALPAHIEFDDCTFDIADSPYMRLPNYTVDKIVFRGCTARALKDGSVALLEIHDFRPQPTDKRSGTISVSGCSFGKGVKRALSITGTKDAKSQKNIAILAEKNTFEEAGAMVFDPAKLPASWTAQ